MCPRIWLALSLLLASAASVHAQDLPGYDPQATCKSILDAETARGSTLIEPPPNPVMKDFYGTLRFERPFNGVPATVIYLCQGTKASGGSIVAELIYIEREDESHVRREFARQKALFRARLGPACRELTGGHPHVTWKIRPGLFADLGWAKSASLEPKWNVVISTIQTKKPSVIGCPDG